MWCQCIKVDKLIKCVTLVNQCSAEYSTVWNWGKKVCPFQLNYGQESQCWYTHMCKMPGCVQELMGKKKISLFMNLLHAVIRSKGPASGNDREILRVQQIVNLWTLRAYHWYTYCLLYMQGSPYTSGSWLTKWRCRLQSYAMIPEYLGLSVQKWVHTENRSKMVNQELKWS